MRETLIYIYKKAERDSRLLVEVSMRYIFKERVTVAFSVKPQST